MTTKHPLARLFFFVNNMSSMFSETVYDRLDIYLDYVGELGPEERIEMYRVVSGTLNSCFPPSRTITRTDLVEFIPARWPCVEWFETNNVDIDKFDDPHARVAVFDYLDIINSFDSPDHKRLTMLLILDAVKSSGNDRCTVEIENLKRQIEDDRLLADYGYGGGTELFETTRELIDEFTPTGSGILMNLLDVYNSSDGDMLRVFEAGTQALLIEDTISNISKEVSKHSSEVAKDVEKVTSYTSKIAKAAGVGESYTRLFNEATTEVMADPNKAYEVISSRASSMTGIDRESIRSMVNNVREAIPVNEIDQMSKVVTESFE